MTGGVLRKERKRRFNKETQKRPHKDEGRDWRFY